MLLHPSIHCASRPTMAPSPMSRPVRTAPGLQKAYREVAEALGKDQEEARLQDLWEAFLRLDGRLSVVARVARKNIANYVRKQEIKAPPDGHKPAFFEAIKPSYVAAEFKLVAKNMVQALVPVLDYITELQPALAPLVCPAKVEAELLATCTPHAEALATTISHELPELRKQWAHLMPRHETHVLPENVLPIGQAPSSRMDSREESYLLSDDLFEEEPDHIARQVAEYVLV